MHSNTPAVHCIHQPPPFVDGSGHPLTQRHPRYTQRYDRGGWSHARIRPMPGLLWDMQGLTLYPGFIAPIPTSVSANPVWSWTVAIRLLGIHQLRAHLNAFQRTFKTRSMTVGRPSEGGFTPLPSVPPRDLLPADKPPSVFSLNDGCPLADRLHRPNRTAQLGISWRRAGVWSVSTSSPVGVHSRSYRPPCTLQACRTP